MVGAKDEGGAELPDAAAVEAPGTAAVAVDGGAAVAADAGAAVAADGGAVAALADGAACVPAESPLVAALASLPVAFGCPITGTAMVKATSTINNKALPKRIMDPLQPRLEGCRPRRGLPPPSIKEFIARNSKLEACEICKAICLHLHTW